MLQRVLLRYSSPEVFLLLQVCSRDRMQHRVRHPGMQQGICSFRRRRLPGRQGILLPDIGYSTFDFTCYILYTKYFIYTKIYMEEFPKR